MIRIKLQVELEYLVHDGPGADFVFNIHAARTACQDVRDERLAIEPPTATQLHTDPATGTRRLRLHATPGPLALAYAATVDMAHHAADPARIAEVPVGELPPEVLDYVLPSRYCQSDRLVTLAAREFGHLRPGYGRVQAICDWVRGHVAFRPNTSTSTTSALDTFVERVGVCRDFAHLMIALCRAANIPARMATGTDYGADPALGPPDFHAYVEAFLGGRWYVFDPSGTAIPMGMVRLATGRDAADVAIATIFGGVQSQAPRIRARAEEDPSRGLRWPRHSPLALSTDGLPGDDAPPVPARMDHREAAHLRRAPVRAAVWGA
ncbi:transglutaminase family protein [Acidovorax sp. NCPPB 2350]|nr:transglutaminase family protein [Acidovorax sp. NCPPB 2350]